MSGLLIAFSLSALSIGANAGELSPEQRRALDLSAYSVTDPSASYVDVGGRRAALADSLSLTLRGARDDAMSRAPACRDAIALPVIDFKLRMPAYYAENAAWRQAIRPLFAFEDAVSGLAGAFVATEDEYHGRCVIEVLDKWAARNALSEFHYAPDDRQAWYNIEDMIFSSALAYSIVRNRIDGMDAEKARIDAWLRRISHNHIQIEGGKDSCCNNHFYRRALHATTVGILTNDNELFRYGVSAIYSALYELTPEGGLPRELARGKLAVHYQNYGTLYLVHVALQLERQGYRAFDLEVGGKTLHDVVNYLVTLMTDPDASKGFSDEAQDLHFMDDPQYFSWAEIYLSRFENAELEAIIAAHRPIYNRSAGGLATLYFADP